MHLQDRLRDAQLVLARGEFVVDEGARQLVLALVAGGEFDRGLAALVLGLPGAGEVGEDLVAQRGGAVDQRLEGGQGEGECGARRGGLDGVRPERVGLHQGLVTQVVAVGEDAEHCGLAVLAEADLAHLAVGDQEDLLDRLPGLDQDLTRRELALREPTGQLRQQRVVVEAPQHRQLAQRRRHDPHLRAGLHEAHPPAPDRVREPPVHPERTAGDLDPGEHPKQPARADALHLRF